MRQLEGNVEMLGLLGVANRGEPQRAMTHSANASEAATPGKPQQNQRTMAKPSELQRTLANVGETRRTSLRLSEPLSVLEPWRKTLREPEMENLKEPFRT